jgi:signal transduction histidine kinase
MRIRPRHWLTALEYLLPWLALLVLAYYVYLEVSAAPYIGFNFVASSAIVNDVFIPHPTLAVGDELITVGSVAMAEWRQHLRMPLFSSLKAGDHLALQVHHAGQITQVYWVVPGRTWRELYARVVNTWLLGMAFWLAGAATLLLVRPKDSRYWLFAVFFLLTALWLVVGNTNRWGHGESRILFRMAVWLSLPVLLHVHWIIPQPLARLPRQLLWIGYGASVLLAALQWFEWVPPGLYGNAFALVLALCLVLLVAHYVRQPHTRRELRLLLASYLLAFVPLIVLSALSARGLTNESTAAALLFLPLLPGAYFYAVFRHRLGGAELRANRLVTVYLFLTLLGSLAGIVSGLVSLTPTFPGEVILVNVGAALTVAVATLYGFPPFARWVERRLLAMPLPPADLLNAYIARISTSLTQNSLTRLLRTEVLPTLLVRQSALFAVHEGELAPLYTDGIAPEAVLPASLLSRMAQGRIYQAPVGGTDPTCPWVRVGLPLQFGGKLIGVWVLGRRDPDDYYSQAEILMLQSLAAETAIALINIEQSARLQALYKSNVTRHEAERRQLAYRLHDDVLGHIVILYNSLAAAAVTPAVQAAYELLKSQVRQLITGLRPAMLDYGLAAALEELVEDLARRAGDRMQIVLEVSPSRGAPSGSLWARHPQEVEEQLFRIVQQACENALSHAQAATLRIYGEITAEQIQLWVEDNGIGFDAALLGSLSRLLAQEHFGLVGMYERAAQIGAELAITSAAGHGTQVAVTWSGSHIHDQR